MTVLAPVAGFERFCVNGETDISGASRAIKDSEIESCKAIGREPIEFRVGTDALSVVVSKDNDFVSDVTVEELALIFSTAETWADVRPEWPAEPIQRFIPGTDSGTFDYFVEVVFEEDEAPILASANTQLSEDDNVLVQGVLGSPYAIGFFGYAYYAENSDKLNVLSIDGVAPTQETVDNNEYPISRPLFIYSDATILQEKPQAAAFVYFFLSEVNNEIDDVGYFPANEAVLTSAMDAWSACCEIRQLQRGIQVSLLADFLPPPPLGGRKICVKREKYLIGEMRCKRETLYKKSLSIIQKQIET